MADARGPVKLTDQIDELLHRAEVTEYTDDPVDWGRIGALNEVKKLAEFYQKQIDDARFELSRGVLDLVAPRPTESLAQIVSDVIETKLAKAECEDCDPW